jgi:hypothetical protein
MALKITKTQVWAGTIDDRPGGLAAVLAPLAEAGANLDCVIARRQAPGSGAGVVFVTPIKGKKVQNAAAAVGFKATNAIATLRVEGPNKAGLGAKMAAAVGEAGVNMRGLSAAVMGNKFVAYLGFDNATDADRAAKAMKKL